MSRLLLRSLGHTDYAATWQAMREFTARRDARTPDELWLTEHPPLYTLGLNRRGQAAPRRADIPLLHTDRGGKMTYHGPGQVVLYLLLDLQRRGLSVRSLVDCMERAAIALLAAHGITADRRADAPGVYVAGRKIAALGLRLKNGCCYHGISLNVDMDLSPFAAIDPCGQAGLAVTQTLDLGIRADAVTLAHDLAQQLENQLEQETRAVSA